MTPPKNPQSSYSHSNRHRHSLQDTILTSMTRLLKDYGLDFSKLPYTILTIMTRVLKALDFSKLPEEKRKQRQMKSWAVMFALLTNIFWLGYPMSDQATRILTVVDFPLIFHFGLMSFQSIVCLFLWFSKRWSTTFFKFALDVLIPVTCIVSSYLCESDYFLFFVVVSGVASALCFYLALTKSVDLRVTQVLASLVLGHLSYGHHFAFSVFLVCVLVDKFLYHQERKPENCSELDDPRDASHDSPDKFASATEGDNAEVWPYPEAILETETKRVESHLFDSGEKHGSTSEDVITTKDEVSTLGIGTEEHEQRCNYYF